MKQNVISALTCAEEEIAVTGAIKLLQVIENIEGNTSLIKTLRSFLQQLFQQKEEKYTICYTETAPEERYNIAAYCKIYKEIAGFSYYSDGYIITNNCMITDYSNKIWLDPWVPQDKTVLAKVAEENKKFKRTYEYQQGNNDESAKGLAKLEIEYAKREFNKTLNKVQNLFLKYQINKYLGKKHKPSTKFKINGKTACELVDIIKKTAGANYDIKCFQPFVQKIYHNLAIFCQSKGYCRIAINRFESLEKAAEAYKHYSLVGHRQANYLIEDPLFKEDVFNILSDPDIATLPNVRLCNSVEYFLNLMYSLQQAFEENKMDTDLVDFLKELGLIRQKEEKVKDGTEHL